MSTYFPNAISIEQIENFVEEYLFDFDEIKACQRIGFSRDVAMAQAQLFMQDPATQRLIREYMEGDDLPKKMKKRIVALLTKEANQYGPETSHAARVAALKQLSVIYGLDKETHDEGEVYDSPVMVVPGIAKLDDWEEEAEIVQAELVGAT